MKKQFLALLVMPALLLTSCGKGGEIKEEQAKQLAQDISEESKETPKNLEIKLSINGVSGKDKKVKQNMEYAIKANEDNELSLTLKGESEGKKYDVSMYVVKDSEYEEVTYVKEYNADKGEYTTVAFTKKGNLLYTVSTEVYQTYTLMPTLMYASYADPTAALEDIDDENVKYYSTGDKNLTIEASMKQEAESEGQEETVGATTTIVYDKGRFKEVSIKTKTSYGNSASMKLSASYSGSKYKISLPSNWKDGLEK